MGMTYSPDRAENKPTIQKICFTFDCVHGEQHHLLILERALERLNRTDHQTIH